MIETWSRGPADDNMPEEMIVSVLDRVRRHPWWHARAALALDILRDNGIHPRAFVADVGCGWGTNLNALERAGYRAIGLDISRKILERIDKSNRHLVEVDLNQPLPSTIEPADALLLLDVIEHLDDDHRILSQLPPLLKPGGIAVVSVPALPELFSKFDEIQGHRRRYVPETLHKSFDNSGFTVRHIFWWGAWMVPVLRRMRLKTPDTGKTYADYLRLPPWPAPLLMKLAYEIERQLARNGRLKTGTSLFAVATRD